MISHRLQLAPLVFAVALAAGVGPVPAADTGQDVQDARREAQIWTTYGFNPNLRASDIGVEVNGSTAILTGTVESGVEKDLAEQIALSVDGIGKVDNRLRIDAAFVPGKGKHYDRDRNFSTAVDDATTTARVKSKLLWNAHTDGLQIDVDTRNGVVTLKGAVGTAAEKNLAARLAQNTHGVVSVNNQLAIGARAAAHAERADRQAEFAAAELRQGARDAKEALSDAWVTTKVKSTLMYSSNVDGANIDVDTRNGVVRLSGRATGDAEREAAVELARGVRGVKSVDASNLKS